VDKKLDLSYTTSPWAWHSKYVGCWQIKIPIGPEKARVFGHGCLLDLINDLFGITGDLFFPTQVENPQKHELFERPMPMPPGIVREALDRHWSFQFILDENYVPACDIYGLSYIHVNNPGGVVRALVPHALGFKLDCTGWTGHDPTANLTVYTKCDAWLERTVDGLDNSAIGVKNSAILTGKLKELEERLAGNIIEYLTEFEEVEIEKYSIRSRPRL